MVSQVMVSMLEAWEHPQRDFKKQEAVCMCGGLNRKQTKTLGLQGAKLLEP